MVATPKIYKPGLFSRFRTRLILLTGLSLLAGMTLTALVALTSINQLNEVTSKQVEEGLLAANQEYFRNYLADNTRRADSMISQTIAEVQLLAGVAQTIEDNGSTIDPLFGQVGQAAYFQSKLTYNPVGGYFQNQSGAASVVSVLPYLVDPTSKTISPKLQAAIDRSALYDLLFPLAQKYGVEKSRLAYYGPPDMAFARISPWTDFAGGLAKSNPQAYQTVNLWNYLPGGLAQSWNGWVSNPATKAGLTSEATFTKPYRTSSSNKLVTSVFYPIWDSSRHNLAGAIAINLSLTQLNNLVENLKVSQSGFAFLTQSDGNVLAVSPAGAKVMGLPDGGVAGSQTLNRKLKDSKLSAISGLQLPQDGQVTIRQVELNGNVYQVALLQMAPLNFQGDPTKGIAPDSWTLGFIIPQEELLGSLRATQQSVRDSANNILRVTLVSSGLALVVMVVLVSFLSSRMTRALQALLRGTRNIEQNDYSFEVPIRSGDEFGQLGQAFNSMARVIKQHTENLEAQVKERTAELEQAHHEITQLNHQLQAENSRMRAELEITHQLQQMILPRKEELEAIDGLEIASYMEPADEVGGDYYDVLKQGEMVKIGIGDVTGHGLESGVLMIMVQTAVRTLLASHEVNPDSYISIINQALYDNIRRMKSNKNMTLSLLDYHNGKVSLSGQHEEMLVVRQGGKTERINTLDLGFPVGIERDISAFVGQREVNLNSGDIVVLYTDGIPEAENMGGVQYGLERLCEIVQDSQDKSAWQIKKAIIEDLKEHIGSQKVFDDITLLVLKQKEVHSV